MKRVPLVVFLFAVACGGGPGPLNPGFAKSWTASITANIPGISPLNYGSTLSITVIGHTATVNNVCPSGGGSFSMIGNGNSASWSASMAACDPILLPGQNCSASFTFTSGSLTLIGDGNTLTGSGTGTVTGCNLNNVTFSMTLDAVPSRP